MIFVNKVTQSVDLRLCRSLFIHCAIRNLRCVSTRSWTIRLWIKGNFGRPCGKRLRSLGYNASGHLEVCLFVGFHVLESRWVVIAAWSRCEISTSQRWPFRLLTIERYLVPCLLRLDNRVVAGSQLIFGAELLVVPWRCVDHNSLTINKLMAS